VENISFRPIWFDSLGAKSSCTLIRTPDVSVLIDPGAAVMQPSFPASWVKKIYWYELAISAIKKASRSADVIVISHYHFDHFVDFDKGIYEGKLLLVKNPNEYINDSQRGRAEHFFEELCASFGNTTLCSVAVEKKAREYINPLDEIPLARDKDFGSYNRRRKQLLELGERWFNARTKNWNSWREIPEIRFSRVEVKFPEAKKFKFGKTSLRFTGPLFHGIEFSRVGWVFATIVERGDEKFIHSSDLNGIYIEDYAELLIKENPTVLVLDGPPTYMQFMLIRTNLNRCIENTCKVIRRSNKLELVIYDHHLLREKRYRERTLEVWKTGEKNGIKIMTAAEFLGKRPVIEKLG
jgi:predicted metallo-beta-lactamase superfamily hydrolase